nr:hypothetical protein [Ruminococcus bromii]
MEEKRINTIVTEESIVESLHKQLDNNEFSMLEKALKAFGQSKSDVSDIDILIDCTSEELQSVNYCELTEKFSKLTIPIKQNVLVPGDPDPVDCLSRYPVFRVIYHIEGTYNLTAELNPVPKEIFRCFYK